MVRWFANIRIWIDFKCYSLDLEHRPTQVPSRSVRRRRHHGRMTTFCCWWRWWSFFWPDFQFPLLEPTTIQQLRVWRRPSAPSSSPSSCECDCEWIRSADCDGVRDGKCVLTDTSFHVSWHSPTLNWKLKDISSASVMVFYVVGWSVSRS